MTTQRLFQLRDEITTKVFGHHWCHTTTGTGAAARHLDAALAAAERVRGRLAEGWLPTPAGLPVEAAGLVTARRAIGMAGVDRSLPQCLAALLRDPKAGVRRAAAAVGRLGVAAGTPEVLAALAQLLRDPAGDVRRAAAAAVGRLGVAQGQRTLTC